MRKLRTLLPAALCAALPLAAWAQAGNPDGHGMPGMQMPGMSMPGMDMSQPPAAAPAQKPMPMPMPAQKPMQMQMQMQMPMPTQKPMPKQKPPMPMPMQMPMPAPADGAVPVGSLPSSDGGIGKPYADYGITLHTMDHAVFWQFSADEFEWARSNHGGTVRAWDGAFTLGTDYNKLVVQSEGERSDGATDAQLEVQWRRAFSPFWNTQLGWRRDLGTGPKRDWAAFGVTGTLPYDIETEATAYVGESGRTALKLKAEYDLSFTQRLVLTPEIEANLYGRSDPARGIGSGLSDASLALRLRYEITRQFAPYVGVSFGRKFGQAASLASDEGESRSEVLWLAGVRFWF